MMLMSFLSWWYTAGWSGIALRAGRRIESTLEFFSVMALIKTLFAPFRQISAARLQNEPFNVRVRAFGERLFSRVFGAVLRSFLIVLGFILACCSAAFGLAQLLVWPLLPLFPVVGLIAMLMNWKF